MTRGPKPGTKYRKRVKKEPKVIPPPKLGRESKFQECYIKQTRNLVLMGYNRKMIAEFFNVAASTIRYWRKHHPNFDKAMNTNKEECDAKVVRSLFKSATGYDVIEKKTETLASGKKKITRTRKHCAPNVRAQQTWLNNRQKKKWKSDQELAQKQEEQQYDAVPVTINYSINPPKEDFKVTIGKG